MQSGTFSCRAIGDKVKASKQAKEQAKEQAREKASEQAAKETRSKLCKARRCCRQA